MLFRSQALTGTAAFQAAAFPATGPRIPLRAFPANCRRLPCAAKMAAVPVRLRAQALTGTAAFQAAAFPATGPRILLRAFPANCRRLPCAAKMAAFPVKLRAQALTGTAAFQAAAFPATGPRISLRAFPANCQVPPMRRQDGGVPSQAPCASADWDSRLPGGGLSSHRPAHSASRLPGKFPDASPAPPRWRRSQSGSARKR